MILMSLPLIGFACTDIPDDSGLGKYDSNEVVSGFSLSDSEAAVEEAEAVEEAVGEVEKEKRARRVPFAIISDSVQPAHLSVEALAAVAELRVILHDIKIQRIAACGDKVIESDAQSRKDCILENKDLFKSLAVQEKSLLLACIGAPPAKVKPVEGAIVAPPPKPDLEKMFQEVNLLSEGCDEVLE